MPTAKKFFTTLSTEAEVIKLLSALDVPADNSEVYCQSITTSLTELFKIDRASIWLFSEDETSLVCIDQFDKRSNEHTSGKILRAPDFSFYFKSLNDADSKTIGLHHILDVPLTTPDRILGVISLEQIETKRKWEAQECDKLKIASISVSKMLSALMRIKYLEDLMTDEREKANHPIKMAHEINNPLTIILGNAYLLNSLAEEKEQNIELQKSSINKIVDAANRIDKIIRGIRFKK